MKKIILILVLFAPLLLVTNSYLWTGEKPMNEQSNPVVLIHTSKGDFKVELWQDKAPKTVENVLSYVDEGFYDGTIFHRVIDGFMIQGGGMTEAMQPKDTHPPIKNEAKTDLKNLTGTIAMARTQQVDSATSQFFVNVVDNSFLDHKNESASGFGYAVFGKVTEGLDVVMAISKVKTRSVGPYQDVPAEPVMIEKISRVQ